ncbi:MAG: hypothetical protein JJE35_08495 [Thermoleophilia bacterium]|nr:hypothetical protein [Thermoleophilia bacterium]
MTITQVESTATAAGGLATLAIPPEYAHWVRLAGLHLLKGDSASLAQEAEKTAKAIEEEAFHARPMIAADDREES